MHIIHIHLNFYYSSSYSFHHLIITHENRTPGPKLTANAGRPKLVSCTKFSSTNFDVTAPAASLAPRLITTTALVVPGINSEYTYVQGVTKLLSPLNTSSN